MKTLRLIFFIFILFLPGLVQSQSEWFLGATWGTPVDVSTMRTAEGQMFYLEGYVSEGIPHLLNGMFVKYISIHDLPEKFSGEFLVDSSSNLDSLEIYPGLMDSANSNLGVLFNQRYLVVTQGVWVKVEFNTNGCIFNTIDGVRFNFELYAQEGVLTSCKIFLRNLIGITNDSSFAFDPLIMTGVYDETQTPSGFVLEQNYPNPFNPTTTIRYEIAKYSSVNLTVYDMLGRSVAELVNQSQPAGIYEVPFDGSNLASGAYIYILRTENFILKKKMILLK